MRYGLSVDRSRFGRPPATTVGIWLSLCRLRHCRRRSWQRPRQRQSVVRRATTDTIVCIPIYAACCPGWVGDSARGRQSWPPRRWRRRRRRTVRCVTSVGDGDDDDGGDDDDRPRRLECPWRSCSWLPRRQPSAAALLSATSACVSCLGSRRARSWRRPTTNRKAAAVGSVQTHPSIWRSPTNRTRPSLQTAMHRSRRGRHHSRRCTRPSSGGDVDLRGRPAKMTAAWTCASTATGSGSCARTCTASATGIRARWKSTVAPPWRIWRSRCPRAGCSPWPPIPPTFVVFAISATWISPPGAPHE